MRKYGPPVYVLHAIVHNRRVVVDFESRGVIFVEDVSGVPSGRPLVFSAHGVPKGIEREALERDIGPVIDATCPLVKKVHREASRHAGMGAAIVLVGHRHHPEIAGTLGQIDSDDVAVVSGPGEVEGLPAGLDGRDIVCLAQTTLTQDAVEAVAAALRDRFAGSEVTECKTVCYASHNRQNAVRHLATLAELVLVVGSANSSNANRLRETAESAGVQAYLIDTPGELDASWLDGRRKLGITAGASTPERIVDEILDRLRAYGWKDVVETGREELTTAFKIPEIDKSCCLRS